MATIYDVATEANVSASTVSRVFNRSASISAATEKRVRDAAEKVGYRPVVQSYRSSAKRNLLVALVIPDLQNPFAATVARGVQDGVSRRGYLSIICCTDGDADMELRLLREITRRQVDGFIITPPAMRQDRLANEYIAELIEKGVPIVFIGNRLETSDVDYVSSSAQEGATRALEYLVGLGHRRIGFIGGYYTQGIAIGRWLGYQEAMITNQLSLAPHYMIESDLTQAGGEKAMNHLLDLPEPPSAVLCVNDLVAIGALQACRYRNRSVPGDVSIVGFDDIPLAQLTTPKLTTVAQPAYDLGVRAAETLLRRLHEPSHAPQHVILRSNLIVRESAAPPLE